MFKVCTIASSSKGNCSFITDGETNILIDCGIKINELEQFCLANNITLNDITAIVITHEHIDHICGLKSLSKRIEPKVYCHEFIGKHINERLNINLQYNDVVLDGFSIGEIQIYPFRTSHDAIFPLGYTFVEGDKRVSIATDLGVVSDNVINNLIESDMAIIEANHDRQMLIQGVYPTTLKRRVVSELGHLSNDESARLISTLSEHKLRKVILAHLSENNNLPELAYSTVSTYLHRNPKLKNVDIEIEVAPAKEPCRFLEV